MLSVENEIKIPNMKWYQSNSTVFIKILAPGCDDKTVQFLDNKIQINSIVQDVNYKLDLELQKEN